LPTAQGGVGGVSVAVTDPQERWGAQQSDSATRRQTPHQAKETRRTRGESVWGVDHPWCHELPPLACLHQPGPITSLAEIFRQEQTLEQPHPDACQASTSTEAFNGGVSKWMHMGTK